MHDGNGCIRKCDPAVHLKPDSKTKCKQGLRPKPETKMTRQHFNPYRNLLGQKVEEDHTVPVCSNGINRSTLTIHLHPK